MPDVLLYAPALARDNASIGRRLVLTERARWELTSLYGPLFRVERDPLVAQPSLTDSLRGLPPGTRYVLSVLKPGREFTIDSADLAASLRMLTSGAVSSLPPNDYAALAGVVGSAPALVQASDRPFRSTLAVGGVRVAVRMESWLAFDTIRRMGFGQVVAAHRHALIIDRGISFVAFDETGSTIRTAYLANIFAPQPRYIATLQLNAANQ
jgi:hypothetical protein